MKVISVKKIIKSVVLLTLLMPHVSFAQSQVDDLLYEGKPIDPACVHVAKKKGFVELKAECEEPLETQINDDGTAIKRGDLVIKDNGAIGYHYGLDNGTQGEFFYRFIGKTDKGMIIKTNYFGGGTGYFEEIGFYERQKNNLKKIRKLASGDRCAGGMGNIDVRDGNLFYDYAVTPRRLYNLYNSHQPFVKHLDDSARNCVARIYMKDEVVEKVEIFKDAKLPVCLNKQDIPVNAMSDKDTRIFVHKFNEACPAEK